MRFFTSTLWPAATVTLFNAIAPVVPVGITFDVPSTVDEIDVADATLVGAVTLGGGAAVASAGGVGDYKPGVGLRIRWGTSSVVGGRRVTGTTFVCPVVGSWIPNGVVDAGKRTSIAAAGAAYIAAAGFMPLVYSPRVFNAPDPNGRNRGGVGSEITSCTVPAGMTWLRSRRT